MTILICFWVMIFGFGFYRFVLGIWWPTASMFVGGSIVFALALFALILMLMKIGGA